MSSWVELSVADTHNLSGRSVAAFFQVLRKAAKINWIITDELEGAMTEGLSSVLHIPIAYDLFSKLVGEAQQYDWAMFYCFCRERPKKFDLSDTKSAMEGSDIVVRLADDTYFYLYTKGRATADEVKKAYPRASIRVVRDFEQLEILS